LRHRKQAPSAQYVVTASHSQTPAHMHMISLFFCSFVLIYGSRCLQGSWNHYNSRNLLWTSVEFQLLPFTVPAVRPL